MILEEAYFTIPKVTSQKPLAEVVVEMCEETDPKPLYCEIPEDLKLKSMTLSGTAQTYTYTTFLPTVSGTTTSTTTTY